MCYPLDCFALRSQYLRILFPLIGSPASAAICADILVHTVFCIPDVLLMLLAGVAVHPSDLLPHPNAPLFVSSSFDFRHAKKSSFLLIKQVGKSFENLSSV